MSFRITGLSNEAFKSPLFGLSDDELAARGAKRYRRRQQAGLSLIASSCATPSPAKRCCWSTIPISRLRTPYRASHAIFVLEGAGVALRPRSAKSRTCFGPGPSHCAAFDADAHDGRRRPRRRRDALEGAIERMLNDLEVDYIHAHYATRGCYAARIERA